MSPNNIGHPSRKGIEQLLHTPDLCIFNQSEIHWVFPIFQIYVCLTITIMSHIIYNIRDINKERK